MNNSMNTSTEGTYALNSTAAELNSTISTSNIRNMNLYFLFDDGFVSETAQRAYDWFTYVIPFLALTLNALSIAVFLQHRSRKSPVSMFLVALAVCDVMAVSLMFYTAYSRVGWWPITTTACKVVVYINGVGRMCSIWLTVLFTIERLIAVRYVFRKNEIITPFRIRLGIIALISAMMVEQSFVLFWVEAIPPIQPRICFTMDASIYHMYMLTLVILNRVFNFILPLILVAVMNSVIVITVKRSSQIRGKNVSANDNQEQKLTRMLVLVSTVSFLLLLPETTSKILESQKGFRPDWLTGFTLLADVISYLNHCLNFFFYVISGKQFRKELADLFLKCRCKEKKDGCKDKTSQMYRTTSNLTSQVSIVSSTHDVRNPKSGTKQ